MEQTFVVTIVLPHTIKRVNAQQGKQLYEVLIKAGVASEYLNSPCGGRCFCGKCTVKVSGKLNDISPEERRLLGPMAEEGWRLACAARVMGDVTIVFKRKYSVETTAVSVAPNKIDHEHEFGFAIDVGTTTVAVYLYDLTTSTQIDRYGEMNQQRIYGHDVISRIQYASEHSDGQAVLQQTIIRQLSNMMQYMLVRYQIPANKIEHVTIVGNTCMQHIVAGIDITPLGKAPYTPVTRDSLSFDAKNLGISNLPNARIDLPGVISGFVGTDTVAVILATGMYKSVKLDLIVDIGTNAEIVLGNKKMMLSCSAAAGPALEGAGLSCGCAYVDGAINTVWTEKYRVCYTTINGKPPIGICGSGAIEILDLMLRMGIIDETGRLQTLEELKPSKHRMMGWINDEYVFFVSRKHKIYISQKDVRQLQLAKAAIAAGIKILFETYGADYSDLVAAYIAGSFGSGMSLNSAKNVGLLPSEIRNETYFLENIVGEGAGLLLTNARARADAENIITSVKSIDIAQIKEFQDEFANQLGF